MFKKFHRKLQRQQSKKLMPGSIDPKQLKNIRFGFFGEFAFALSSWMPYLKFLKEKGLGPIKTIGPAGSSPFYYFSDDHIESEYQSQTTWGNALELLRISKTIKERFISPCNEHSRSLGVGGYVWNNTKCHDNLTSENYSKLNFNCCLKKQRLILPENSANAYCVVNVKTYWNHGNTSIRNFYDSDDLELINRYCKKSGLSLVLNRFPNTESEGNNYVSDASIIKSNWLHEPHVIDMRNHYKNAATLSECNEIQINLMHNANHVFATNGGNAFLSLIVAPKVSIMMQGGGDYAEFKFLNEIYSKPFNIAYSTKNLLELISRQAAIDNLPR